MDAPAYWITAALALLAGVALGVGLHAWLEARAARERRRIPAYWPLSMRAIANSEERRVWRWLARAFFDHHVMIKMPVTRFTLPREREGGTRWYELLSGVYCTFTICGGDGRVVGCVDVPGHNGISKSTRVLKQSLLEQCDIGYWVVTSGSLPAIRDIRREFLGDAAAALEPPAVPASTAIDHAQGHLRATLERRRTGRSPNFDPMATDPGHRRMPPPRTLEEFDPAREPNSFLAPLDSRMGPLR